MDVRKLLKNTRESLEYSIRNCILCFRNTLVGLLQIFDRWTWVVGGSWFDWVDKSLGSFEFLFGILILRFFAIFLGFPQTPEVNLFYSSTIQVVSAILHELLVNQCIFFLFTKILEVSFFPRKIPAEIFRKL